MVSDGLMTLYYSKSTGIIIKYCTGVQDMSIFGELQADNEIINDFIVVDLDERVLSNISAYRVNSTTKTLGIMAEFVPQYPIVQ